MIVSITVCTILFIVGLSMSIAYFTGEKEMSCWAAGLAVVMALVFPAAAAFQVYLLRVRERLVLGEDRFQVVHRVKGRDVVVTQLPYANIAEIVPQGDPMERIGIDLHELDDPHSFDRGDFQVTKDVNGC